VKARKHPEQALGAAFYAGQECYFRQKSLISAIRAVPDRSCESPKKWFFCGLSLDLPLLTIYDMLNLSLLGFFE